MANLDLKVKQGSNGDRIELECPHQKGIIYLVPSEASWVCDDALLHVHALAGFFSQLIELKDHTVRNVMQRWGIYYRPRPLNPLDDSVRQSK